MHFNPRSREGSDAYARFKREQYNNFNPRSREGSDLARYFIARAAWQFQSTLPRRERRMQSHFCRRPHQISIHAPAKGATQFQYALDTDFGFQSTLPRRERRNKCRTPWHCCYFNPRSREGSDAVAVIIRPSPVLFQSTLPRRERRKYHKTHLPPKVISIHAPAKGATVPPHSSGTDQSISIHAPAKGATIATVLPMTALVAHFNPRSREGSDRPRALR